MTDPRPDDCVDLPYNVTWDKANCPKLEVPIGAQVCQPIEPGPNPPVPPLPCPVNPLYYEYVRWVGKLVTTGDGATMYNQVGDIITSYTSPWFRKQTNSGDEFVYLGGMMIKYGPSYAYRWMIGDMAFDPNDPDYITNVDNSWQPYSKWNNDSGLPHPWRASYKAQATNYSSSDLSFYSMHIGDLGGNGYTIKSNAEPHQTNSLFYVDPNYSQSGNYTGSYELQGHWEFSNDGVTPIGKWSGTDDNGNDISCPVGPGPGPTPEPEPTPEPRPTPLPCPVDPSDYQWVRYVGNVTSSDMSRMNMNSSNSNDVWTGNQITTRWYRCPNATYPDSYVSLGGMWVKYPPAVAYTWSVADKAFDPSEAYWYDSILDAAIGPNYEPMVNSNGKMPPWRAKYRVVVGPGIDYGHLAFYQPHIGAIGGDLGVADPVYSPTWSVTIDNSNTTEVFQGWYQIDGWWEFSNDKEQVLGSWSGQDFNGLDRDCDDVECQERQTYGVLQYWDPNDNHWIDAWSNSQPKANLARKITGVTSGGQDLSYNYLSTATFITIPYLGDDPANEYSSNADWSGSEEDAQQVRWRIIPRGDTPNNPCLDDSEIE